jgi:hypothetical protein
VPISHGLQALLEAMERQHLETACGALANRSVRATDHLTGSKARQEDQIKVHAQPLGNVSLHPIHNVGNALIESSKPASHVMSTSVVHRSCRLQRPEQRRCALCQIRATAESQAVASMQQAIDTPNRAIAQFNHSVVGHIQHAQEPPQAWIARGYSVGALFLGRRHDVQS